MTRPDRKLLKLIAVKVQTERIESDMTRAQLASKVGISYSRLTHFELAEDWVAVPVFLRICAALGMDLVSFL